MHGVGSNVGMVVTVSVDEFAELVKYQEHMIVIMIVLPRVQHSLWKAKCSIPPST